ncbi:MAG: hypothetical protein SF051_04450 [Elusimicrobiota bacterium]|nr:hypothetical protein [Elusimicrobiota bacterium]
MLDLILTLAMTTTQPAVTTAQFQPCVWPRTCKTATAPVQTAQFQPCVWPRTCKSNESAPVIVIEAAPAVAQFQPCVWPRTCKQQA